MATARKRATEEATKHIALRPKYEVAKVAAERASNVWEPLLKECYDLLKWIDRPLQYAIGKEAATDLMNKVGEALGEPINDDS